jgi:hypothetical protein
MPSLTVPAAGTRLATVRRECRRPGCAVVHRAPISLGASRSHGTRGLRNVNVPFGLCSQIHAFSTQMGNGSSNCQTSSSPVKPSGTGNVSGLMYSRATRQVPEFRGRYRGRGRLCDDAEAREGPRVPDQVPGSRGIRDRQRAVPSEDGRRALRVGREIRARLTILLGRRRREVPGSDHEGAAGAQGSLAQPVSRQRREMDSWDRITN